ncbi:hypothetical protein T265_14377, partial [Opisthorchis viverrini]
QLNVLQQATPCFRRYDIPDIATHAYICNVLLIRLLKTSQTIYSVAVQVSFDNRAKSEAVYLTIFVTLSFIWIYLPRAEKLSSISVVKIMANRKMWCKVSSPDGSLMMPDVLIIIGLQGDSQKVSSLRG